MKKLLVALSVLVMSVAAFADGTSCSVRGASGQVSLGQENSQSDSYGCVTVWLQNNSDANRNVNVMVYVYDAYTNDVVAVKSVSISGTVTYPKFCGLKKDHPYYFRISDAHCG